MTMGATDLKKKRSVSQSTLPDIQAMKRSQSSVEGGRMSTFTFTGSEVLRYRLYTARQDTDLEDEDTDRTISIRRAITAPTDTRQREKMKLIGALRRLMRPRATYGPVLRASRRAKTEADTDGYAHRAWQSDSEEGAMPTCKKEASRSGHQTRGYQQHSSASSASSPAHSVRHGIITKSLSGGGINADHTKRGYGDLERLVAAHSKTTKQQTKSQSEDSTKPESATMKEKKKGEKPKHYSHQLRILQGKKQNLLRISSDNTISHQQVQQEENLEVGGVSIQDSHDNISGTSPVTGLSMSSMSNITSFNSMLGYTRRRLDKSGTLLGAKPVTHTTKRPAIVIPCHTNIECMYCKLYNEDHALHSQCATPDIPVDVEPPEPPKPVPKILLSMEGNACRSATHRSPIKPKTASAKSTRSTKSQERTTPIINPSPDLELSANAISTSANSSEKSSSLAQVERTTTNNTDKKPDKTTISLPVITAPKSDAERESQDSKPRVSFKSPVVAPKIYKLKYTKSTNPGIGKLDLGLDSPFVH